ncbi:MAG: hypothetical protein RSA24_00870, partial [Clostridia bacterium]
VCAQFRGRVFSISGNDKRYPPLRDGANSPLKNGYDLIHPNCRCEFRSYFEALHSDKDNDSKQKFSNRSFDGDKRTMAQAKAYQNWQTLNRQIRSENIEYEEMKKVLGDKMPYTTIGGFKRARRAESNEYEQTKKVFIQAIKEKDAAISYINKKREIPEYVASKSKQEAKAYAQKTLLIPNVDYGKLDINVINEMNKCFAQNFALFPELKDKIKFIGDCRARNKLLRQIEYERISKECHREYDERLSSEAIKKIINKRLNKSMKTQLVNPNTMARSSNCTGIYENTKGITVNDDYGKDSNSFVEKIKRNVDSGFHPAGTASVKAVLDHEVGHQIDRLIGLQDSDDFKSYRTKLKDDDIKNGLSKYALYSDGEFVAEAWAEYCNNESPREIAKNVGEIILRRYEQWKK